MAAPRRFTVADANALVPTLEASLRRMEELRQEIGARANELERLGYGPLVYSGPLPAEVVERKRRMAEGTKALEAEVDAIAKLGCILADLDRGLIDFWATHEGRDVFLSWQLGEAAVAYYHLPDHPARKPL